MLAIVQKAKKETPFLLYHYCVMNNHLHMQLLVSGGQNLAIIMKTINQTYSLYYKKKYGFVGHLWQGRFHSRIVTDEAYQSICGIYIELNPVRAGITKNPEGYPWSSYVTYAYGQPDSLIDQNPLYLSLAVNPMERQAEYRAMTRAWQQNPIKKRKDF